MKKDKKNIKKGDKNKKKRIKKYSNELHINFDP